MSVFPESKRQQLQISTREAAAALVEDLAHIRQVLQTFPPDLGNVRRLSAILRRLLIEQTLLAIAAPRMGRLHLEGPDNSRYYERIEQFTPPRPAPHIGPNRTQRVFFFGSGAPIGKHPTFRATLLEINTQGDPRSSAANLDSVRMRLDSFLAQQVLYFQGLWASRGDIIKFMANVGSGVHSGIAALRQEQLIAIIRDAIVYTHNEGKWGVTLKHKNLSASAPFEYHPNRVNCTMIEILAAAYYLADSEDVKKLETLIKQELSAP